MAEYLHPNVSSRIIDNSSVGFVSALGVTKLCVVFTADKGKDNEFVETSSASEWLFRYGKPNMKKHGQAAYNAMNWLKSNGSVLGMRVCPPDAGYSHAFLGIQVKETTKKVKDNNGNLVDFPNVSFRLVTAYTYNNNKTATALLDELNRNHTETIDGYKQYWLFGLYPEGRGKYYDRYGFRISLTNNLDDTYNFRVYNFEVIEISDSGSVQTINGPFEVSLSPDALSNNNESMFIEQVINEYSPYVKVIFNEEAYDKIGEILNPNVSPDILDMITLVTREVGGSTETYFDPILQRDVDIHIRAQAYDDSGEFRGILNYIDPDNTVENSILAVDNSQRNAVYNDALATVDNMKLALSRVKGGTFGTLIDEIYKKGVNEDPDTGTLVSKYEDANTAFEDVTIAETAYKSSKTDINLTTLEQKIIDFINASKAYISVGKTGLDYVKAIEDNADTTSALVKIMSIENRVALKNMIDLKAASQSMFISNAQIDFAIAKTASDTTTKLDGIKNAIDSILSIYDFVKSIASETEQEADEELEELGTAITNAEQAYTNATDPNLLTSDLEPAISTALSAVELVLTKISKVHRLTLLENDLTVSKAVNSDIALMQISIKKAIDTANGIILDPPTTLQADIALNIDAARSYAQTKAIDTYRLYLKNPNTMITFGAGNNGSLDESNPQRSTIAKNLLIDAYTGLIDPAITNKKQTPVDMVLDANYPIEIKNALNTLVSEIRKDFPAIIDTGFTATPEQAINFRKNKFQASNFYTFIVTQDFITYDSHTGQDIKVTSPFYLASKIPALDEEYGMQYPMAGPRRGAISGFKKMSWNPTEPWMEQLYKKQINYFEDDGKRVSLATQQTSQTRVSALSNFNNVRVILRYQRDIEELAAEYKQEFNINNTIADLQVDVNAYSSKWVQNGACKAISSVVYASDYDRAQKIIRIRSIFEFTDTVERIMIDLVVNK